MEDVFEFVLSIVFTTLSSLFLDLVFFKVILWVGCSCLGSTWLAAGSWSPVGERPAVGLLAWSAYSLLGQALIAWLLLAASWLPLGLTLSRAPLSSNTLCDDGMF